VRTMVMDVLEDQFILDRRLPRTLGSLFFRPGHLTTEYVNGRRVRYIHPFRLYLVSSLVFFLLLSFLSLRLVRQTLGEEANATGPAAADAAVLDRTIEDLEATLADTLLAPGDREDARERLERLARQRQGLRADSLARVAARHDSALARLDVVLRDSTIPAPVRTALGANRAGIEQRRAVALARRDTLLGDTTGAVTETPAPGEVTLAEAFGWEEEQPGELNVPGPPAVDSVVVRQLRRLGAMTPRDAGVTVLETFLSYVPTMMFILLPVFAVVLKLLYVRRDRYYAEHFLFLLHVHSFVFMLATVMLLLRGLATLWIEALLGLWILIYIYIAMKRVYGQGWLKTFVKYSVLGWTYVWILAVSVPVALVAALLLF
ncbi:MAG: DUF3667 domain-containing protein, partial [Gemmatimonadota bacterium]